METNNEQAIEEEPKVDITNG